MDKGARGVPWIKGFFCDGEKKKKKHDTDIDTAFDPL